MIEFSLSIDLGKKERIDPSADGGMPVDRGFVAQNAARLYLEGKPTDSLADRVAAGKVVDFAAAQARLRAPERGSLASTQASSDER